MDGMRHPVGDEPTNVYWKRRLAVVIAIIAFALLLWWVISALSSSDTPAGTPTTSPTVSTSPTTSAAADPGRDCTADDFTVTTGPENANFKGSAVPTFTVDVKSAADTPCMVDPTTASKIIVKSGDELWFDSSKCTDYAVYDAQKFLLDAGASHELTATWNRGRDQAGCSAELVDADTGYYWVTATVQGVSASKLQFQLS